MGKKLIYFVRHGESELNAKGIRQGSEGKLTEKGRNQALQTAKKFPKEKGKPQIIISSPYERTRETTDIIAKELNMKNIEYSDLLMERKNPSEIIGKWKEDLQVKLIVDQIDKSFHDDNLRYSDEENFTDLKNRTKKLLTFIKSRKEKRMIMVTHAIFLKMIVSYILKGEELTSYEYNKLSFFNDINNAGITIIQYIPHWFKKEEWKLLVWNDEIL
ncbi:histidine phosphatase family protein [Candidatus Nomurabacteria bacterium]|nr:histidine phosphatase family protein [Candidatus Nomurabacteria bacterium]